MTTQRKPLLFLFLAGLLLWAGMTRPLPRHFGGAIPYNERRTPGTPALSALVPGDHIHYDEYNSLEDGSAQLVICKVPDLPAADTED